MTLPFGPFHPDKAGINTPCVIKAKNVYPGSSGFLPFQTLTSGTSALAGSCRGAVSVLKDDGSVTTFAGTQEALYQLSTTQTWTDVTRLSGGLYAVNAGEQWKYALYGSRLMATNGADAMQYIDLDSGTNFAAVAGSPPIAKYIAIIREFVFLACVTGNEKRVQWSANGNSESWTPATAESDYQDIPDGGPVRGIIGGETGYVFQAGKVTRLTYAAGTPQIFQFDEVEGASGLAAPHSLVRLRADAFYLTQDGFRRFDLKSGSSVPIGVNKWVKWFLNDIKAGTEGLVAGAAHPVKPVIVWAYVTTGNVTSTPDRLLIYDWSLDEATYADLSIEALMQWLSPGVSLDALDPYGALDALQFSLDSPFWKGGASLFGLFGTDLTLSLQSGTPMVATLTTADGQGKGRLLVTGTRPHVDASGVTVAIAARERVADSVSFNAAESMEDTGICPAWASGNIVRGEITIPGIGVDAGAGDRDDYRSAGRAVRTLPSAGASEREVLQAIRELIEGRSNAVGTVTLTPAATSTVVSKVTVNANAGVFLFPSTASAALSVATTYANITPGGGSFTITHTSTAAVDRTFYYAVLGG